MGLDMYLSAKRYLSKYFKESDSGTIESINSLFGLEGDEDGDYGAKEVTFRAAYWRKANAIHQWFVENVQDGKDDCNEYFVSKEQLKSLLELCELILTNPKKAKEQLPTTSGFFFGSTEYDEFYMQDIEYTVTRLKRILEDEAFAKAEFYYQASW